MLRFYIETHTHRALQKIVNSGHLKTWIFSRIYHLHIASEYKRLTSSHIKGGGAVGKKLYGFYYFWKIKQGSRDKSYKVNVPVF